MYLEVLNYIDQPGYSDDAEIKHPKTARKTFETLAQKLDIVSGQK